MGKPAQGPMGEVKLDPDCVELIQRAANGDQSAMTALYDATSRQVFGLVLRILGRRTSAEEVLLDVYTQAWKQASHYDVKRGSPTAWLLTIARSRAIDRRRSEGLERQRGRPLDAVDNEPSDLESPEQAALASEHRERVREALGALAPEQREVIELSYFSGLSHTEIAARLGQPVGTVKTRARLGMMNLTELLRPLLE